MLKIFITALFFIPFSLSANEDLDEIEWMTEVYPPYNYYDTQGRLQGISIEILEALFNDLKTPKSRNDIKVYPWARGYQNAQRKDLKNILFSMTRTKEREDKFKWLGPIEKTKVSIFGRFEATPIELQDLKNYRFAAVRDDVGYQMLLEYGVPTENIMLANSISQVIDILMAYNRVDFAAFERKGFLFTVYEDDKYNRSTLKEIATLKVGHLWFAVNKSISNDTLNKLQQSLNKVKKDPELRRKLKNNFKIKID